VGAGRTQVAHDLAVGQEQDPVGDGGRVGIVCHHHGGLAQPLDRPAQELEDLGPRLGVEIAGRFVSEDDRRLIDQRPSDSDALALSAGQFVGPLVSDVIQADGGTRTASITGAWVALADCLNWMKSRDMIKSGVLRDHIAAVSCGVCKGTAVLDLDYAEDSEADTDANFVMTGSGDIVEIQATAEKIPFSEDQFAALLALARKGIAKLVSLQKLAVA